MGRNRPAVFPRGQEQHDDNQTEQEPVDYIEGLPTQVRSEGGIVSTLLGVDDIEAASHGWALLVQAEGESRRGQIRKESRELGDQEMVTKLTIVRFSRYLGTRSVDA